MKSLGFVQSLFRGYYQDFALTESLSAIEKREFGFASFEGRMVRHQSFQNERDLFSFLFDFVPRDAYVSCAYYQDPEAEMDKKGWLGADLIFDIDADHIPTKCDKTHDDWVCGKCGFAGKGITPESCPVCGGEKFAVKTWPCELCVESAKEETTKLLEMLTRDFGFSEKDIRVFFSGHRGYHVHVESEVVKTLDSVARKEIVDYVCGLGFDITLNFSGRTRSRNTSPSVHMIGSGYYDRITKGIYDFILNAKQEDYKSLGIKSNIAEIMVNRKDSILSRLNDGMTLNIIKGVSSRTWETLTEFCVKSQFSKIDTVVTTDIHRLIRLANSLHGKTGFKKVAFAASSIDSFDPFKDAIAFKKGTTTVLISNAPKFRIGDETFGPYSSQKVTLPTAAAILLICKGRAEVAE